MNKKLADTFDLPDYVATDTDDIRTAMQNTQYLENSLNDINGFDQHDEEMDELSKLAVTAHTDLMDLGMSSETRVAGELFSSAATMLKIAVDAKNNKVDKKLKLLKLQLDKMRLDKQAKPDEPINAGDIVLDRNDLLAQIKLAMKSATS